MRLDGKTIQAAIMQLVEDYKFDPYQVIEIVRMGIKSAFKKDYTDYKKCSLFVDINDNGEIHIYKEIEVVETPEDTDIHMTLKEAKKIRSDVVLGEKILIDVTPAELEFTRVGIQSAAQTIKQHLKGIERERFFEKFKDKEGELLKARVIKVNGESVVLDVDGIPVVLQPEGQIPQRVYEIGEEIFVYLKEIAKGQGGVVLDITQSSEEYIEAIIKKIVPEVEEGSVLIEKIARIPGKRTKVLVSSVDPHIDPVGVMVGQRGDRINIMLSLLENEKIDYIKDTDDMEQLIISCLKPAEIKSVSITNGAAKVYVKPEQKALAIGKGACNIKLAGRLTGMYIEVI